MDSYLAPNTKLTDDRLSVDEDLLMFITIIICLTILCITIFSCWCYFNCNRTTRKILDDNARKSSSGEEIWTASAPPPKHLYDFDV